MQSDRGQAIRERAYALWEEDGRPDGKELEHWLRAQTEVAEKSSDVGDGARKFVESPAKARAPVARKSRSRRRNEA